MWKRGSGELGLRNPQSMTRWSIPTSSAWRACIWSCKRRPKRCRSSSWPAASGIFGISAGNSSGSSAKGSHFLAGPRGWRLRRCCNAARDPSTILLRDLIPPQLLPLFRRIVWNHTMLTRGLTQIMAFSPQCRGQRVLDALGSALSDCIAAKEA